MRLRMCQVNLKKCRKVDSDTPMVTGKNPNDWKRKSQKSRMIVLMVDVQRV